MDYFAHDVFPAEEGFKRYSSLQDVVEHIKPTNSASTLNNYTFKTKGTSALRLIIRKSLYDDFQTNQNVFRIKPFLIYNGGFNSTRSFRTNPIGHSQQTWSTFKVTIAVPSILKLKRYVSSEGNYDKFHIQINGTTRLTSGNNPNWVDFSYNLGVGTNTISFGYTKDGSVNSGIDAGLVDNLEIVPVGGTSLVDLTGSRVTIDGVTSKEITSCINNSLTNDYFYVADITGLNPVKGNDIFISGLNLGYVLAFEVENSSEEAIIYHRDEVFNISDLSLGKRMRCRYVASTGLVGKFTNLGVEDYRGGFDTDFINKEAIPTAPNGNFYFIMFGRHKETGQPLLMADRILQHTITHNALKIANLTVNRGIPDRTMGERKVYIAVPSGHNYVAEVVDGEGNVVTAESKSHWQEMVDYANTVDYSTLPNGYNQVWNDSISTITKDLINSTQYIARKFTTQSNQNTSTANANLGFRPMLEISSFNKLLIFNDGFYKTLDRNPYTNEITWRNIGETYPTVEDFAKHGIYDFSIMNRVGINLEEGMEHRPDLLNSKFNENAKIFTKRVDLKQLRNIKRIEVE